MVCGFPLITSFISEVGNSKTTDFVYLTGNEDIEWRAMPVTKQRCLNGKICFTVQSATHYKH